MAEAAPQRLEPGLELTFSAGNTKDTSTAPNVWLYVKEGESPTPFLPAGKFSATWKGFIKADLRGDFAFQADLNGSFKLEVNGQTALEASGTNSVSALGKTIRLTKGTNSLSAIFSAPAQGDSKLRLLWKPVQSFSQPIPSAGLSHFVGEEESSARQVRLGRELFLEHRCAKCHTSAEKGTPELTADAPTFEGIGGRRNNPWLERWILDPKKLRSQARMPAVFKGKDANRDARDVVAFLKSLPGKLVADGKPSSPGKSDEGQKLFETLSCAACHDDPESTSTDATKISLKAVAEKFAAGALTEFLKKPGEHYQWIRMPEFKLTDAQRESLAAYLLSESPRTDSAPESAAEPARGKDLVQTRGCLNCHASNLENKFSAKALSAIGNQDDGCLAVMVSEESKAPDFSFSDEERAALRAFLATDRRSLTRHVPVEFAERQTRLLNCAGCHGKVEGVAPMEILGGKLKPEWSGLVIAGDISEKPRPWLDSQMPGFRSWANAVAEGLAMQHGFSPRTPAEGAIDPAMAKVGQKLVSVQPHGFSCVSCHGVGSVGATQVFEAPGIDLATSGARLQADYFHRWVRAPSLIDPTTKMPTYFDENGKSPLPDIHGGDGLKQIDALWHYIRLGEKMPPPITQ